MSSGVLATVNRRTQLAGQNRLELLLFRLQDGQWFGINVFKVREVIQCPNLTAVHAAPPVVRGISSIRGNTISIIDLGKAIGGPPVENVADSYVIITEFNRSVQGFLVRNVERIVNVHWEDILPPPQGAERDTYMTAITRLDGKLVQVIDVEKVLAEVMGVDPEVSRAITDNVDRHKGKVRHVLVADDSSVARNQIHKALNAVGVDCTLVIDGRKALNQLKEWANANEPVTDKIAMVVSDIEMPEMDGYTLVTEIRKDPRLSDLYVLLHSSLSGGFNMALSEKVGADQLLSKFNPDALVKEVLYVIENQKRAHKSEAMDG